MKNSRLMPVVFTTLLISTITANCFAQKTNPLPDTALNNLVLPPRYKTSLQDAIPHYTKTGKGKQILILIPGLGFDETVFSDFSKANKNKYTLYCITIPGYGKTKAPPTPPKGTSFGEQSWNKSLLNGLCKLIDKKKLNKPIIVGHFVQGTQLALRMAVDHPGKVGGVIILGGAAKFILISQGKPIEYPLQSTIKYIDTNTAPNWFGTISKKDFDDGNYLPEIYSIDTSISTRLWQQTASVPLPVMVRYLCEFLASDITLEVDKIKCPVLVLRAMFNNKVLQNATNNYVQPQFIDSWTKAATRSSLIKIIDINDAASCVWKDKPDEVTEAIEQFIETSKTN
jgi:pimeloyl-ACP methyl ester carboxylesterase